MGFDEVIQIGDETHYFFHRLTATKARKFYAAKRNMFFFFFGGGGDDRRAYGKDNQDTAWSPEHRAASVPVDQRVRYDAEEVEPVRPE